MNDHEHYEELAALAAGGFLSDQELTELGEHTQGCGQCLKAQAEFTELFRSGMPLAAGEFREAQGRLTTDTDPEIRDRFLKRARLEGISLAPSFGLSIPPKRSIFASVVGIAAPIAALLLLAIYGGYAYLGRSHTDSGQSQQKIEQLQSQNASLNTTVSQLNQSILGQQHEIQNLRAQLEAANKNGVSSSVSKTVQLPDELVNSEKQLTDARNEIDRIKQLRANDEASLVAQQVRIAELANQLRVASATLDLERQLTAAGKDIRELLTARQLHVIDVRDTDTDGKPSKAFGRIFVTEGKTLTFYAFDLNQEKPIDPKHRFEVWGTQQAKGSPAHNLGFLYVDDAAQRRWTLKVNDPQLVKEVESVFVTVEPAGGNHAPSGQTMLYAYLGQPNHP
jgi:outer membrane murein-binding lipoprotein Lpp